MQCFTASAHLACVVGGTMTMSQRGTEGVMAWLLLPLLLLMYTSRWLLVLATRPGLGARAGLPKSPVLLLLLVWRWKPPVGGAAAIARCDRLFDFFIPGASGAIP
jgi:hypothetical protein